MRLLDRVMQSSGTVNVELAGRGVYQLPGAASRAQAVAGCPLRYVLADDVRTLCGQIIAKWPDMLDPGDSTLRLPAERIWLEWNQPAAAIVAGAQPQLCGMLATVDASGRRGRLESFWEDHQFGVDRAQIHAEFDFDKPLDVMCDGKRTFALPDKGGMPSLARHSMVCVDPGWLDYFHATALGPAGIHCIIAACAKEIWRDLPLLLAFSRLLNARPEIDMRLVDRAQLNVARARRGKPPLLDHIELSLKIGSVPIHGKTVSSGRSRAEARLHRVRGHMVKRGQALFWRSSHLRGRADLPPLRSRTIDVSLDASLRPLTTDYPRLR